MRKILFILLLLGFLSPLKAQETYLFAHRDTCDLYLDIFRPADGAPTTFQGRQKPVILHVFGGGFVKGERSDSFVRLWADILNKDGYTVVTVDYRLGMKGYKLGRGLSGLMKAAKRFELSQELGKEDVFAAIRFLADNPQLGVPVDNLVLAGCSAGAIITLASAFALANGKADGLPEGFTLKGAMSFAGAIISNSGSPQFKTAPCPVLLMHGTADGAVVYNKLAFFGKGIWGSSYLVRQFKRKGYDNYCIYRFKDRSHDVAVYHQVLWPLEKQFLEENVILGHKRTVDALVDDDSLPSWGNISLKDIY